MTSRLQTIPRKLSTQSQPILRTTISGSRLDKSAYTPTGGSGQDSTTLSASLSEASSKAVSAYRTALRDIPSMRKNFTIMEDKPFLTALIRDLFAKHSDVTDPKIVDMLVFKALQELREIREQWKSRHHVYAYIHAYHDKLLKEEAARRTLSEDGETDQEGLLREWRERGLVPPEIQSWGMYLKWREDEESKFMAFAMENRVFSQQVLKRNASKATDTCSVM